MTTAAASTLKLGLHVTLLCLLSAIWPSLSYSQRSNEMLLNFIAEENYEALLHNYQDSASVLDAEGLYYLALASLYTEQLDRALDYAEKSITLDPGVSSPYMLSATCYIEQQQLDKAIEILAKAIRIHPESVELLGRKAFVHAEKKEPLLALEDYKEILKISKDVPDLREAYCNSLFNVALVHMESAEKADAEPYLVELLDLSPTDYAVMAKLIQIYNHQQAFDKVVPLRMALYRAHEDNALAETDLEDMFCIDQYQLGNTKIQVFERFQEEPQAQFRIFYKHVAYIDGDVDHSIQTEYSPAAEREKNVKFLLGMDNKDKHYTYPIGLSKDYQHHDFKRVVAQILQGNVQPMASSVKKKSK